MLPLLGSAPKSLIDVSLMMRDSGNIGTSFSFYQVRVRSVTSLGAACADVPRSPGGPDRSG